MLRRSSAASRCLMIGYAGGRCSMRNAVPHGCTLSARTTHVLSMHGVVAIQNQTADLHAGGRSPQASFTEGHR
jgi:hypothetical protein